MNNQKQNTIQQKMKRCQNCGLETTELTRVKDHAVFYNWRLCDYCYERKIGKITNKNVSKGD